jgi:signal transduction histidine kinase
MVELTDNAQRILEHIYDEKDPTRRMVGSICIMLLLDTPDWQTAEAELSDQGFVKQQGNIFSITPQGIDWVQQRRGINGDRTVSPDTAHAPATLEAPASTPSTLTSHPLVDFLIAFNHDLRSPLNSIIGFSRVILKGIDGPINDMQAEDLQSIYDSGQRLLGMLSEIVDMARIEADSVSILAKPFELSDVFDEAIDKAKAGINDKPITFHTQLSADTPLVWADKSRVQQILSCVVEFSARNLDMGSIFLGATAAEDYIRITVEDTGYGWEPDEVAELLAPYRSPDSVHHIGGTGLSLAIARRLAEMQDGSLTVQSRINKGTTFTLTLPTAPPDK